MMSKQMRSRKNSVRRRKLDTVGVVGSIPIAPTISVRRRNHQVIEIPSQFEVVPAVVYRNGRFRLFRALTKSSKKKCEKSVTSRRSARRSA